MASYEYYNQAQGNGQGQAETHVDADHQPSYGSHNSNHPPEGRAYEQQPLGHYEHQHNLQAQDQGYRPPSSHQSYAPQQGYNAPQYGSNDHFHRPDHGYSPYLAQHQAGLRDSNESYGTSQQSHHYPPTQPNYHDRSHSTVPGEAVEGERGLGSIVMGGAGGALLGHELGGGAMGTIGGMIAGAIGANILSDNHEKKKKHKKHRKHGSHDSHDESHGSHHKSHSSHHGSHSSHSHSHHGSHSSHSHHGHHSSHRSHGDSSAGLAGLYVPDGHHRHHRSRSRGRKSSSSSSSESGSD